MLSATGWRTIVEREKYTEDAGRSNCETGAHYGPEITGLAPPISHSIEESVHDVLSPLFG